MSRSVWTGPDQATPLVRPSTSGEFTDVDISPFNIYGLEDAPERVSTSLPPVLPDPASPLATIRVGPSLIPFTASVALLCAHSPFFAAAFTHPFRESTSHALDLPSDGAGAFALALQWMTTRRGAAASAAWSQLCALWILADKLLIGALCDDTMAVFPRKFAAEGGGVAPRVVNFVYANTVPLEGQPLRRIVVDVVAWGGSLEALRRGLDEYDREFLRDILRVLMDLERRKVCTELSMRGQPFYGKGIETYFVCQREVRSS